jgi:hypothetical protein
MNALKSLPHPFKRLNKMKKQRSFTLTYPLTHKVVRDLKIVDEKVADLRVEGVAYPSGELDIDFVWYGAEDIKPILEALGDIERIYEYCQDYFQEKEAGV